MMNPISLIRNALSRSLPMCGFACLCLWLAVAVVAEAETSAGAGVRETDAYGEASEVHLPADRPMTPWIHDPTIFQEKQGDLKQLREGVKEDANTVKLENLVPPIHYGLGEVVITDEYIAKLRKVLDQMQDRPNVRLHFIGHADNLPLRNELQARYGDNIGLSLERAVTAAEYCQRALGLPPEAISYEGLGDRQPVSDNATEAGRQRNRRVEVQVWHDQIEEKPVQEEVYVPRPLKRIKVCRTEKVCKLRYKVGQGHRAQVKNLITPLHYDENNLKVSKAYIQQILQSMTHLSAKQNLVVRFTAYTDNAPLTSQQERIYGDALGLSKAVARRVAQVVQDELALPNAAIESHGRGALQPIASNATAQGRALNRRVEISFWYDDPLQELPDEPQLCPDPDDVETVVRVFQAPSGDIEPILISEGRPVVPEGYAERLRSVMNEVSDKSHVRLRFVGLTGNQRLDRRTAVIYGDDIGLSIARARRTMEAVSAQMGLTPEQAEFDGRGYVQSDDVVNGGFAATDTSRVEVQVVYDEAVALDPYEGVDITAMTREVTPVDPFALNLMRITVDGQPLDDPGKCSSDVQRCTDVALEKADIQLKHDSLRAEPRLNVTAWPRSIRIQDPAGTSSVRFRMYSNYRTFIDRAEVRIFEDAQSVRDVPEAVVAVDAGGNAVWRPAEETFAAPVRKLKYVLRVYNPEGLFDETEPQPMWIIDAADTAATETDPDKELLVGYGESRIAVRNIPISGGTVLAQGSAIPEGHGVWMAGFPVPVDENGRFVAEEILPEGIHTVEVAVLDDSGNGELFLRDLALKRNDWFTVGIADLTFSANNTSGPAELLRPDRPQYSKDMNVDGRLGFYTNGKFKNEWSLTASADTQEGPLDEIFSNFMEKTPDALFRRMDPDYHYPTYGDDSTVVEDAPTSGKFYVKAKKNNNHAMWGNFDVSYMENELAQVDRGLYGANLRVEPGYTTSFGESRFMFDGFAADPGTVAGRDEFGGTGGSLYYLRRQDILVGSERVRIEVRDKDSGMVLAVKNLVAVLDYDIDYLQGRILLNTPLPSTSDDDMLVSSDSISGNSNFLVVRYEYTPGFEDPNVLATGGRAQFWLNDYIRLGVTGSQEEDDDTEKRLGGVDLTLRKSALTWLRVEGGQSRGAGVETTLSSDGGYDFTNEDTLVGSDQDANAYRIDASLGLKDLLAAGRGQLTFYVQDLAAGYSAPGLATDSDLNQFGGTANLPLTDRLAVRAKADKRVQDQGLDTEAGELDADYRFADKWTASAGVRHDNRTDNSAVVAPTQEQGERTDTVVRLTYDSQRTWRAYTFVQETVRSTGNRDENGRYGAGGSWRVTDRFRLNSEVSDGDQGPGAVLGTEFLYSDRTTLYMNYALENDRTDNGVRATKGSLVSGFRTRYSDSASVFLEERHTYGDVPTGLVHATGVELAPFDHLNLDANAEYGTLKDPDTAAEIERTALGLTLGYGFDRLKIASGVEYRVDNTEQPDASYSERTTWLFKNSLKFQLNPDWRLIGKFNYATSESSLGDSYAGDFTEAVMGYAYRPVNHDRLNALIKYTYFYNLPSSDQVVGTSNATVIQRSHIGSIDVLYDLTPRWTVGGKYAYRLGQVAMDRENPEFFDSRAHLYVARLDWHFIHRWDALVEGRMLDLPDAEDRRSGALVGLYRHIGEHVKLGVGYNFADFSDDLTQLDYQHQGVFINLVGKI